MLAAKNLVIFIYLFIYLFYFILFYFFFCCCCFLVLLRSNCNLFGFFKNIFFENVKKKFTVGEFLEGVGRVTVNTVASSVVYRPVSMIRVKIPISCNAITQCLL